MAFLVGPSDGLDTETFELRVGGESARQLKPINDPERPIEPAAFRLRLAVRADEQPPRRTLGATKHIADPVDDGVEPGLGIFSSEPTARSDIDLGIGRS